MQRQLIKTIPSPVKPSVRLYCQEIKRYPSPSTPCGDVFIGNAAFNRETFSVRWSLFPIPSGHLAD